MAMDLVVSCDAHGKLGRTVILLRVALPFSDGDLCTMRLVTAILHDGLKIIYL
jgi:hypothetical protein